MRRRPSYLEPKLTGTLPKEGVLDQNSASWNQVARWLLGVDELRWAA